MFNSGNDFEKWLEDVSKYLEDELNGLDDDKKTYKKPSKNKVYRKFGPNTKLKEIFPRNKTFALKDFANKNQKSSNNYSQIDISRESHEGNQSSRGSIHGKTLIGSEDHVNPDLRRRLQEKKAREKLRKEEERKQREKEERIKNKKEKMIKNKKELKKAIIFSEILQAPLAKRKNR